MLLKLRNGGRFPRLVSDRKWLKATEREGEQKREIEIGSDRIRERLRNSQEHREISYEKTLHSIQNNNCVFLLQFSVL